MFKQIGEQTIVVNGGKIPPAFVICCKFLLAYLTKLSIETNSVDPDQTAPIGAF